MIKTELCNLLGIKYPIIQAGMGPFGTNKLCIAAANAGVLGLISSSGIATKDTQPGIYNQWRIWSGESPRKPKKSSPSCRDAWRNSGAKMGEYICEKA